MAGKAVLIKDILFNTLREDKDLASELAGQFNAFKDQLIHDLSVEEFSDIYAETIAYGMFAARLHDDTPKDFSREEALQLLPKSNPFLRNLFSYVAGPNLDEGIRRTIDELAEIFQATDLQKLFQDFGKFTQRNDPFIHFYETFLAEYNPAKRKARGVWYTPEPVVNFIVRAVDDVLKTEFGLADGLADTSKITVDWDTGQTHKGKPIIEKKEMHRVQILDPAAGTGTFLAEVIKQIAPKIQDVAPGQWSTYVEKELIPRLHGFELLMASYAMCHMKLDMMLKEMHYKPTANPPRLGVYLTNSLEEGDKANQTLPFAQWLSNEAKQANTVKRDMPIMCVIGNPPYSIQSGNLSTYQVALIKKYRSVDGYPIKEKGMLQFEKNINNDYIKFIALAEKFIVKNDFGILAFITSHGYLKSSSFRGMRQNLKDNFDKISILDLHGNSEIKEVVPDGKIDKNVFDIKQGVAIIIAVRSKYSDANRPSEVRYGEIWGSRQQKNNYLFENDQEQIDWVVCNPVSPNYTFHPSANSFAKINEKSFALNAILPVYSSGVITARDFYVISESTEELLKNANEFSQNTNLSDSELCKKLGLSEKKGWDVSKARKRLRSKSDHSALIFPISYRPFDNQKVLFDESLVWTTARSTMDNMLRGDNLALVSARSEKSGTTSHFYISKFLVETKCGERTTQSAVFPLYLYPAESELDQTRRVNMDPKIRKAIEEAAMGSSAGGTPPSVGPADISPASGEIGARPDEVAIFDYIYGVLHCPQYRETYREFLKIDFPRVPYPPSAEIFWDVSKKGTALRRLHLMEEVAIGSAPFKFDGEGDSVVGKVEFKAGGESGRVFINESQYFDDVPLIAWNFYIGGYQPAQKWLKDRKGRALSFDDIRHYRKIIKILSETNRIMKTIDMPLG